MRVSRVAGKLAGVKGCSATGSAQEVLDTVQPAGWWGRMNLLDEVRAVTWRLLHATA